MTLPKYAARRDSTEAAIIDGLNAIGWDCEPLSSGKLPDLLCRSRSTGQLVLLEIESGHYKRYRSESQKEMLSRWQVPIVKDFAEAARAVGAKIL